jgi:site-specific DNA-methyltransferase (cytosine-N4-specific)
MMKQSTRYSAHGLHQYRGKFNPQVVRAIGNILNLPEGAWVLDPFCGSGTTLLECNHVGWNAVGIDLNPLGVLISNSKILALHTPPELLRIAAKRLSELLQKRIGWLDCKREWIESETELVAGPKWREQLPNYSYLAMWFPKSVLAQLVAILREIDTSVEEGIRPIFRVVFSDILRDVSYQDPGDLRIRRRKNPCPNYPASSIFSERLERTITSISDALKVVDPSGFYQAAFVSDSRLPLHWIYDKSPLARRTQFDSSITSPPYATALPYIDTQRLSLCLLGLTKSTEVMGLDRQMIGTREILDSRRESLETHIGEGNGIVMSQSVISLCQYMLSAVSPSDGFRRRNMPALIYSYFHDMAEVLKNVQAMLKPSGIFALIVGPNKTTLGGEPIVIDTPKLLADIASLQGWCVADIVELNTYQRFDMHQRNSIRTESLVLLKKVS